MHLKHIKNCRLCKNPHLTEIVDLGEMPSQGFFIYKDKPAPPDRKIPTKIVRCDTQKWENACGLVQNSVIVPPEILYSNYGYLSGITASMTKHLKNLNDKIVKVTGDLTGRIVCDIGMNDGTFLSFYNPGVQKLGVDPSDIAGSVKGDVKVINECFPTPKLNDYNEKISVLSAFACVYDFIDIEAAFNSVQELLTDDGIFVFEVAYLPTVLKENLYDGLVHEHVSLFSFATLEYALNKTGLKAFKVEKTNTNSGSLLVFACRKSCQFFGNKEDKEKIQELRIEEFVAEIDEPKTFKLFQDRITRHRLELINVILKLKEEGKKIHIYGASTKLNTILEFIQAGPETIDCAAERDPRKWGGKLLSGIPIVSEEESRKTADVYLVGPYHFFREILEREKEFIINGGALLFPLPSILLVNKDNYESILK